MKPLYWIAAILAANAAVLAGIVWYGPWFGSKRSLLEGLTPEGKLPHRSWPLAVGVMLIAAAMLAHNFSRIGGEVLRAKPWLFFMMSGGLALAFVCPAVYLALARHGVGQRGRLVDCGFWLAAYLAMGTAFWALS